MLNLIDINNKAMEFDSCYVLMVDAIKQKTVLLYQLAIKALFISHLIKCDTLNLV